MPTERKVYSNPYDRATITPATRRHLRALPWQIYANVFDVDKRRIDDWKSGNGTMVNWQKGFIRWIAEHPENAEKIPRMIDAARDDGRLEEFYVAIGRRFRAVIRAQLEGYRRDERHR